MPGWELLAIDDGSVDGTGSLLRSACAEDGRIRVFETGGAGLVEALNLGIERSRARWVARMDADDEMHPLRLERQCDFLAGRPEIGLVGCLVKHGGDRLGQGGYRRHVEWLNGLTDHEAMFHHRFADAPVAHPSVMFRRELAATHGGYREGNFPEDYELWLRWLEAGVRFGKVPERLLTWHDSPERLSRSDARYSRDAFHRVRASYLARWGIGNNPHHPEVWIWGAGRVSRGGSRALIAEGMRVVAWVDVDQRKWTRRGRDGVPVVGTGKLPDAGGGFLLTNVGVLGARQKIAGFLMDRGWTLGRDWLPLV